MIITLDTIHDPLMVEAEIIGPLAIHPTPNDAPTWSISYVPSGRRVHRVMSPEQARDLAGRLQFCIDWPHHRPLDEVIVRAVIDRWYAEGRDA